MSFDARSLERLQHGIAQVGAIQHRRVQGRLPQVSAGEIGVLKLGAKQAGAPQIGPVEIRIPQVGEVEGHSAQVGAGEVVADQHMFGVVHRGPGGGGQGQQQQRQQH